MENTNNASTNTSGTNAGVAGSREKLWTSGTEVPVREILGRGSFTGDLADVDLTSKRPADAIRTVIDSYQADGNPDAMLLVGAFARKEFLNPTVSRRDSNITGHASNR